MPDARWNDPREYGECDRHDERPRVYDNRDPDDHDPRDSLTHDLDLPRGQERELVLDRDRVYELNGDDTARWPPSAPSAWCPKQTSTRTAIPSPSGDTDTTARRSIASSVRFGSRIRSRIFGPTLRLLPRCGTCTMRSRLKSKPMHSS